MTTIIYFIFEMIITFFACVGALFLLEFLHGNWEYIGKEEE